jgi:hypothetical protein
VWAKAHPEDLAAAEEALAVEFESQYESVEMTAREAEGVLADETGGVSPTAKVIILYMCICVLCYYYVFIMYYYLIITVLLPYFYPIIYHTITKAACASWMRLHPSEMNAARDEQNQYNATLFEGQFAEGTAEVCYALHPLLSLYPPLCILILTY